MPNINFARKSKNLESALRAAFWSGNLPAKKWRQAVMDPAMGHKAILKTSFEQMPAAILVGNLGEKTFLKRWPGIRKLFDPENPGDQKRLLLFDSTWGILATGDSQYPVSDKVASLSKGRLELLRQIVNDPGISIYALSLKVRRQYSRVFKDVQLLVRQELVDVGKDATAGRVLSRLYARDSINTRLAAAQNRISGRQPITDYRSPITNYRPLPCPN